MNPKIIGLFFIFFTHLVFAQSEELSTLDLSTIEDLRKCSEILPKLREEVPTDTLISYGLTGLRNAKKLNHDSLIVYFSSSLAHQYMVEDELDQALAYFQAALTIAEKILSKKDCAGFANNIGLIYESMKDYNTALAYYFKSIKYYEASAEPNWVSFPLGNVSNIYYALGDIPKAIEYTKACIPHSLSLSTPEKEYNLSIDYVRLCDFYEEIDKIDSAFLYINKAIAVADIIEKSDNVYKVGCLDVYSSACLLFAGQGDDSKAEYFFNKCVKYQSTNPSLFLYLQFRFAIYLKDTKTLEALYADSSNQVMDIDLKHKVAYYELIGDYENALIGQKKVMEEKLQQADEFKKEYTKYANIQYQSIQKDNELNVLKARQITQERNNAYLLLFIGFALVTIIALILYSHQNKIKNKLLAKDIENKKIIIEQAEQLKKTDALKSRFFSNISHELRTPLTLMQGPLVELMYKHGSNSESLALLQLANENCQQLITMTNQIFDLSKSEFKKIDVSIVKFQLPALIDYLLTAFNHLSNSKEIQLHKPIPIPMVTIVSDAEKLIVVLKNLISNAFKYTPSLGKITLSVLDMGNDIQIVVQDTGRGISSADLPHIFERYFQTNNPDLPLEGGAGIGLAICKEYIELLGGSIRVESEINSGSSFIVTCPKYFEDTKQSTINFFDFNIFSAKAADRDLIIRNNGKQDLDHLLIVEDNLDLCNYLQILLGNNYKLSFSHNGVEALEFLKSNRPDLIISDLMMPVMDGMQLLRQLKESTIYNTIPVLILTAKSDLSDHLMALRIGVDDYLLKPFDSDTLKSHIIHLLDFAEGRTSSVPFDVEGTAIAPPPVTLNREEQEWLANFEELVASLVEDIHLNLDMLANELNISKTHLNRKINALIGVPPKRYIQEIRLQKARKLLEEQTYYSVKAVAYSAGFKSAKVFSRNFKTRFGKYPSDYFKATIE